MTDPVPALYSLLGNKESHQGTHRLMHVTATNKARNSTVFTRRQVERRYKKSTKPAHTHKN